MRRVQCVARFPASSHCKHRQVTARSALLADRWRVNLKRGLHIQMPEKLLLHLSTEAMILLD